MSAVPSSATFSTTLWAGGGNNVGIVVPDDVLASLGRGKRVPVVVTVDGGFEYRSTVAQMGGQNLISFNAATRTATGLGAGDEVQVRLTVDDQPRVIEPPEELAAALAADPAAAEAWRKLSYSKQRAHAEPLAAAKAQETRDRRLAKILAALRA